MMREPSLTPLVTAVVCLLLTLAAIAYALLMWGGRL